MCKKDKASFFMILLVFVGFIAIGTIIQSGALIVSANLSTIAEDEELVTIMPHSNTSGVVIRERRINDWGLGGDTRSVVHAFSGTGGRIGAEAWLVDSILPPAQQSPINRTGWHSAQGSITVRTIWTVDILNRFDARGAW